MAISNHLLLIPFALRRPSAHRDPPAHINKLEQQNQRTLFKTEGPPFLEIAPLNTTHNSVFPTHTTCRCKQQVPFLLIPFALRHHPARRQQPANIDKQKQRNHQSLYETESRPFLEMAPPQTSYRFVFSTLITCPCKEPTTLLIVFEFLHQSSRRHPPADINVHKEQNQ